MTETRMTYSEWYAEGVRLFGKDPKQWRFQCPRCKESFTAQQWLDGEFPDSIAARCINPHCGHDESAELTALFGGVNPVHVGGLPGPIFDFCRKDENGSQNSQCAIENPATEPGEVREHHRDAGDGTVSP